MGVTRDLAAYAAETRVEDIPTDVIEVAKLSTLNIAGACLGGCQTRIGRLHVELAKDMGGGNPQATILGDGARVSVAAASYANGSLGFALDYEDMLNYVVHAGYATVAAGLAVGEHRGVTGRDFLAAVVLGYEVSGRIGVAVQPSPERGAKVWGEQYHPFASVVTAGRLLGLGVDEMEVALGIAGTYCPVPSTYKYFGPVDQTRPIRETKQGWGWMCLAGVVAAQSASRGFQGGAGFLDGEHGFWIMHGSDRCDFDRMAEGLGTTWLTRDTEFKLHPSIGVNHPAYWATKQLVEEHGIRSAEVSSVRVKTLWADRIGDGSPDGEVDAQFSLPYTLAATLMSEPVAAAMYAEEKRRDPELLRLLDLIELVDDPEANRAFYEEQRIGQTVEILLTDGRELRRAIEFPRDKPPFGRSEVEKKFETLADGVLDPARRRLVRRLIDDLDQIEDVASLTSMLY
jgi:2-methylcitrate dehydratase PrpD